ncbi:hypothetical protein VNO78_11550 [Psophocarpus tetragonolobus]|uniref:Uncharacterized protein n=1 Tax=Psophocarpus tetragonolobus TaxID=3891 RepID=A0AAN9XNQ5_PSOTE
MIYKGAFICIISLYTKVGAFVEVHYMKLPGPDLSNFYKSLPNGQTRASSMFARRGLKVCLDMCCLRFEKEPSNVDLHLYFVFVHCQQPELTYVLLRHALF